MPNLVGTGLNQVPINGMLGGLAYQNPEHASIKNLDLKNLSQINSEISGTAADVFVYDTRKDSDGGAWRKRTQTTSWYNETLNTQYRGSRREFPAVAVIVAESTQITIYDGDDPDLPMWMVFYQPVSGAAGVNRMLNRFMGNIKAISMLNGNLFVCANSTSSANRGGALWVNFISEISYAFGVDDSQGENIYGFLAHNIAQRNTILGTNIYGDKDSKYQLISSSQGNDVAMTVLPNAPIDDATGLPIPTIAVATGGGVSVITDSGSVVDIYSAQGGNYNQSKAITITEENYLWWLGDYFNGSTYVRDSYAVSLVNFPTSDFTWNNVNDNMSAGKYYALTTDNEAGEIKIGPVNTWAWNIQERNALGGPSGLAIHKPNIGSETNSLIAAITSDYNTGWMHGDIKGAFLSDTDTTNVTDNNLVTNSDFASGISGYTASTATLTHDSTNENMDVTPTALYGGILYSVTPANGKQYIFGADITPSVANMNIRVQIDGVGANQPTTMIYDGTATKRVYGTMVGDGNSKNLQIVSYSSPNYNNTFTIDNVFFSEMPEKDRSVNNKGLQVFGTVTKSAVATGADLVSYSGFSASNYLQQPYNSDLLFGTSDFTITGWINNTSASDAVYEDIICFGNTGITGYAGNEPGSWFIQINKQYGYTFYYRTSTGSGHSGWTKYNAAGNFNDFSLNGTGVWYKITLVKTGGRIRSYTNDFYHGSQEVTAGSFTTTTNLDGMRLRIGWDGGTNYNYPSIYSKMALWRISKSAPSPEQIKKMYEDEKVLFQENAKATLYGSSDAVTALAYDDTTNLLHVGTSAGRSEFQGLCRINNTTDAVTTAISASNGLVAEQ